MARIRLRATSNRLLLYSKQRYKRLLRCVKTMLVIINGVKKELLRTKYGGVKLEIIHKNKPPEIRVKRKKVTDK